MKCAFSRASLARILRVLPLPLKLANWRADRRRAETGTVREPGSTESHLVPIRCPSQPITDRTVLSLRLSPGLKHKEGKPKSLKSRLGASPLLADLQSGGAHRVHPSDKGKPDKGSKEAAMQKPKCLKHSVRVVFH